MNIIAGYGRPLSRGATRQTSRAKPTPRRRAQRSRRGPRVVPGSPAWKPRTWAPARPATSPRRPKAGPRGGSLSTSSLLPPIAEGIQTIGKVAKAATSFLGGDILGPVLGFLGLSSSSRTARILHDAAETIPAGSVLAEIPIKPDSLGSRLSAQAALWDRWIIGPRGIRVKYQPASATTVTGSIGGYIDYDPQTKIPTTQQEQLSFAASHEGYRAIPVWTSAEWVAKKVGSLPLYVKPGAVGDTNWQFNARAIIIAVTDLDAAAQAALGNLVIDYDVDFSRPQVTSPIATTIIVAGANGETCVGNPTVLVQGAECPTFENVASAASLAESRGPGTVFTFPATASTWLINNNFITTRPALGRWTNSPLALTSTVTYEDTGHAFVAGEYFGEYDLTSMGNLSTVIVNPEEGTSAKVWFPAYEELTASATSSSSAPALTDGKTTVMWQINSVASDKMTEAVTMAGRLRRARERIRLRDLSEGKETKEVKYTSSSSSSSMSEGHISSSYFPSSSSLSTSSSQSSTSTSDFTVVRSPSLERKRKIA